MKIHFKQPKYIIPLIILPFLIFGFFIMGGKTQATPAVKNLQQEGINVAMPGVDSGIANAQIKDKFDAYQAAFKNARDSSAIGEVGVNAQSGELNYQSVYTSEDLTRMKNQQKIDSITKSLNESRDNIQKQLASINNPDNDRYSSRTERSTSSVYQQELDGYNKWQQQQLSPNSKFGSQDGGSTNDNSDNGNSSYDQQMKLFKDQMRYIDSVQKEGNNNRSNADNSNTPNSEYTKKGLKAFHPNMDTTRNLSVSLTTNRHNQIFNTVPNNTDDDNNITAMIDEDVKATLGSRVRIRLLKDIYVGDYLVKKGNYIYGMVTGFQKQRVNISISRIMYNNNISLPVKMDVFDNDGYLGLYVPGSDFREFSKEIGSTASQGMSTAITPDGSNITTGILSQLFNTTTTTMANLLKKDRAFLKYNYIIFLKENKD